MSGDGRTHHRLPTADEARASTSKTPPEDNIYFLTFTNEAPDPFTNEAPNPFDTLTDELLPRLFDSTWTASKHRFPWISSHTVENKWNNL